MKGQDYVASIENGAAPTFIIPLRRKYDQFLISDKHKATLIDWNGIDPIAKIAREVFMVESGENTNWNIGKSSPSCKFYGGTFREVICSSDLDAIASAYMYTKLRGVKRIVKYMKVAGGIDWNIQESFSYLIDSCNRVIREYDWEPNTGKICEYLDLKIARKYIQINHFFVESSDGGRIVYTFDSLRDEASMPLGMTIDTEGFLCVATTGEISEKTISPSSGSIFMVKGLNAKGYPGRKICI